MTRTRMAAEETEDWEVKEVVVPPVAKHSVEKVSRYIQGDCRNRQQIQGDCINLTNSCCDKVNLSDNPRV